jgi:hypothetical protein
MFQYKAVNDAWFHLMGFGLIGYLVAARFSKRKVYGKGKTSEILLNLESDSNVELYQKVKTAIEQKPTELLIELVGVGNISQDIALAIYDLVQDAKNSGLKVATVSRSSLYDGSLLLWILGDKRRIRSNTAFFQLDSLKRLEETDWSDCERVAIRTIKEPAWVCNYRQVVKILNQYIPVEELADRRIPMDILREYGLIDSEETDKELKNLFKRYS